MRSNGLSIELPMLPKLGAVGMGGGARRGCRGRSGGDELFVGSEAEYECRITVYTTVDFREPGVDCAVVGGIDKGCEGAADSNASFGAGGHNGLLGSAMGLEMSRLSIEVREERLERCLVALIESVSLDHEKARPVLDLGVFFPGVPGGVASPTGTRSSTSLSERFSLIIASSPNMIARVGKSGLLAHCGGCKQKSHSRV